MMEKLKNHYLRVKPRRFVVMTVILLILTDLLSGYYLILYWIKMGLSKTLLLKSMANADFDPSTISQSSFNEAIAFFDNSVNFFLFIILVNNLFFYFFYLRKKLWAQGFVLFYTLTAAVLSLSFLFDGANLGIGWFLYNLATIPLYIYLYFGVKLLKDETTQMPKKKGR